jgi:hypothetical protein
MGGERTVKALEKRLALNLTEVQVRQSDGSGRDKIGNNKSWTSELGRILPSRNSLRWSRQ